MQQWRRNVPTTTSVQTIKTSLECGFSLSFYFFIMVSTLHLVNFNNCYLTFILKCTEVRTAY